MRCAIKPRPVHHFNSLLEVVDQACYNVLFRPVSIPLLARQLHHEMQIHCVMSDKQSGLL